MLLAFAAAAWALVFWHNHDNMGMTMAPAAIGSHVTLFVAMWAIMMMAMMLPSAAPMILAFHKAQAEKHQPDDASLSTWLFVAAYLLVWWGFAVYAGARAAGVSGTGTVANTTEVGGLILMSAGLYQLTPLKEFCLSKCRSPMDFIALS